MSKGLSLLKQLAKDEEGTALIEYTMLLGIIAVAVITIAFSIGGWAGATWLSVCNALKTAAGTNFAGAC